MKIVSVIGARPQIIKAAALSRAIKNIYSDNITELIVHTGQHYDDNMSQVFFDELGIPKPNYNLNVGSSSHGVQTARMIEGLEEIFLNEKPDYVVVYGDTNSTLAAAIAASKIHIPIVHIEAGLRSFNKRMPEEINRIMCDHASTLLFSPTKTGYDNLIREGFEKSTKKQYNADNPAVFHCGDVMYDNSLYFKEIALDKSCVLKENDLKEGNFILGTIHRDNNTDQAERLNAIISSLIQISENENIVLPLHPRTAKLLDKNLDAELFEKLKSSQSIKLIPPVSFLDMIALESNCKMVITDSGGVQKESYFFEKPCIILRPETEWKEIVEVGAAVIADADENKILMAYEKFLSNSLQNYPDIFGDGKAAEFICKTMIENN
ncbi:MAG: UDP-N-acetylglucosamine 2-epimerase (non-hydrolyzing) [Marinilabiliales bacterium]|nr:MAG: UDP-N-acetylglucosamine 2-epimerase (non-hydrolyzing) [Marinilabiliales bacterium]